MTVTLTKPTVGGSENTWGTTINTALDDVVDLFNGVTESTPDLTVASWSISGTSVTSTAAELNLLDGSVANTVVNSKAVVYGSAGEITATTANATTVTATTVNATTVDLGDWTITQSGSDLKFAYQGTDRFKLSSAGALTVEDNVTAYGSA